MLYLGILLSAGGAFFTFWGLLIFSEPYGVGKLVLLVGVVMLIVGILLIFYNLPYSESLEEDYEISCPRCYARRIPIKIIDHPTHCEMEVRCPECRRSTTIIVPLDERDDWIDECLIKNN